MISNVIIKLQSSLACSIDPALHVMAINPLTKHTVTPCTQRLLLNTMTCVVPLQVLPNNKQQSTMSRQYHKNITTSNKAGQGA